MDAFHPVYFLQSKGKSMAARTYIPGLRLVARLVERYISRWQVKLEANLTEGQYACAVALLSAATECLVALGAEVINP